MHLHLAVMEMENYLLCVHLSKPLHLRDREEAEITI
jgi:hypothetical protein